MVNDNFRMHEFHWIQHWTFDRRLRGDCASQHCILSGRIRTIPPVNTFIPFVMLSFSHYLFRRAVYNETVVLWVRSKRPNHINLSLFMTPFKDWTL